jgi:1-acyl-sn-glycerol-3-phosphate acyltransferase
MNEAVMVAGITDSGRGKAFAAHQAGSTTPATVLRAATRTFCVLFFSGIALLEIAFSLAFLPPAQRAARRARWLHRWCRFACHVLGLRLTTLGSIPRAGLLVCNHLSYLDIIALSAVRPCVFVAKSEVSRWPLFGWLARSAGTIFVERQRKSDSRRVVSQMSHALKRGMLVVLFPEGTSSDGATVLPFKPALLEPARVLGCLVSAGAIRYTLRDGSVADEVCYWREMTLLPHLVNLFSKRQISAEISFSEAKERTGDRKRIARQLHDEVDSLLANSSHTPSIDGRANTSAAYRR